MTLLAYSCDLCPVSDTTRTLPGIILIGIGFLSESEDSLRTSGFKNTLLRALDGDIVERLRLQPVQFELKHEIEYPGDPIDRLCFLEEGMASITTTFEDGSQVEVGMFGYESVIGVSALMGTKKSLNRVYTQIAGHGYTCRVEDARREFDLGVAVVHRADEAFSPLGLRVGASVCVRLKRRGSLVDHVALERGGVQIEGVAG